MGTYTGYKEIPCDNENLSNFYTDKTKNWFDCVENEYIGILDDNGEMKDQYKWCNGEYRRLVYKPMETTLQSVAGYFKEQIRPRNAQQRFAFDMLQDERSTIKVLTGRFGSGKSLLMIINALSLIQEGKYDKLVWVRNNIEVKDTVALGSLPGDSNSKLLPFAGPLVDHLGGYEGLNAAIAEERVELQHLGYIRGRDFKNSIIMCSEAENLTTQHIQLLIGRVGEGSCLYLDGDWKQTDKKIFQENSGMRRAVDKLAGNRLFGYVDLPITERSETARLADLLD